MKGKSLMSATEAKIMGIAEAAAWAKSLQDAGKSLAVTNGVFDLLHRGHLQYLSEAAEQADALLVAINSDASVKLLKGPERPIVNENDRAYMLASLECVSAVVIFDAPKPVEVFKAIHPNVYVKGGDYTVESLDPSERSALLAAGADSRVIPFVPGYSTTGTLKKAGQGG